MVNIDEEGDLSARSNLEFVDFIFSGKYSVNQAEGTWRNQTDTLSGDWVGGKD